jgi:hypothetical protein
MVAGFVEIIERKAILVAGGGFVPQPHVDSVQLAESTIVRNAKKGYKGKSFIQFSFNLRLSSFRTNSCLDPLLRRSLRECTAVKGPELTVSY